jgi:hypothetical protein
MKGWKVTKKAMPVNSANLIDIMSEQVAQQLQGTESSSEVIDEDLLLAQQLQAQFDEEMTVSNVDDDIMIAQILQANEEEANKKSRKANAQDTAVFEKIGTISHQEIDQLGYGSQVHSSEWFEAVKLERKLGKFDEEKQASVTKHDPLIRALRNSEALTELEGAGDIAGGRLLVSPSVGFSLRSFEKKQRKHQNDIAHRKKASNKENSKIIEPTVVRDVCG